VSSETLIALVRGGWLVLALMMLFSRFIFQAAGPERMRTFLNGWQAGGTKRIWGACTLGYAALLVVGAVSAGGGLGTTDWLLFGALLAVLVADGLVNVLPAGFETFKDRMQTAWVERHRGTGREGDRHLFATVNALLAVASVAAAAFVIAYRPVEMWAIALATAIALVLTVALVGAAVWRTR
jgi:hypothetical protein